MVATNVYYHTNFLAVTKPSGMAPKLANDDKYWLTASEVAVIDESVETGLNFAQ